MIDGTKEWCTHFNLYNEKISQNIQNRINNSLFNKFINLKYELYLDESSSKYLRLLSQESIKLGIPIIAILDTNSNPEGIDFPIPGNDDARRSIDLYCNLMKDTINDAKKNLKIISDQDNSSEKKLENKTIDSKQIIPDKKLN